MLSFVTLAISMVLIVFFIYRIVAIVANNSK